MQMVGQFWMQINTLPTPFGAISPCSALASIWWLITPKSLSTKEPRTILTASRGFGVMLNIFCTTTEGFQGIIFQCI